MSASRRRKENGLVAPESSPRGALCGAVAAARPLAL